MLMILLVNGGVFGWRSNWIACSELVLECTIHDLLISWSKLAKTVTNNTKQRSIKCKFSNCSVTKGSFPKMGDESTIAFKVSKLHPKQASAETLLSNPELLAFEQPLETKPVASLEIFGIIR